MHLYCFMQLKKLFGSNTRVKLMQHFLMQQDDEFYIRELTRTLHEQINSLRRELENLEKLGMLKSRERNRKKFYRVNPHFILLPELTAIVVKTNETHQDMVKELQKLGTVEFVMLSGVLLGLESDVDLLLVGEIASEDLEQYLSQQYPTKAADMRVALMSKEDFLYRLTLRDKFLISLLENRKNLILKNKFKKDTERLLSLT